MCEPLVSTLDPSPCAALPCGWLSPGCAVCAVVEKEPRRAGAGAGGIVLFHDNVGGERGEGRELAGFYVKDSTLSLILNECVSWHLRTSFKYELRADAVLGIEQKEMGKTIDDWLI